MATAPKITMFTYSCTHEYWTSDTQSRVLVQCLILCFSCDADTDTVVVVVVFLSVKYISRLSVRSFIDFICLARAHKML